MKKPDLNFDPSRVLTTRFGEPMRLDDKEQVTLGWIMIYALDNMNLEKADGKELRRRNRIATEIQDAQEQGLTVALADDEVDLIDDLVLAASKRLQHGGRVYGLFDEMVTETREASKAEARPSGNGKGAAADAV